MIYLNTIGRELTYLLWIHSTTVLNKLTLQEEKQAEAEAMLKLAITTCESGRMDESKASLNSYFNILKELGKKPPHDVLQLADKLELSLDSSINNTEASKNNLPETEIGQIKKTVLEDVPEQTNYANVMDGIVRSLEEKAAYEEALPLLNDRGNARSRCKNKKLP